MSDALSYLNSPLGEGEKKERLRLKTLMEKKAELFIRIREKYINYAPDTSKIDNTITYYENEIEVSEQKLETSLSQLEKKYLADVKKLETAFRAIEEKYKADLERLETSYQSKRLLANGKTSYIDGLQKALEESQKKKDTLRIKEPKELFMIRQEFNQLVDKWNEYPVFGSCPVVLPAPNTTEEVMITSQPLVLFDGEWIPRSELEEYKQTKKLREEARREVEDRVKKEQEEKEKEKKEEEKQRRIQQQLDIQRQDSQRESELQKKEKLKKSIESMDIEELNRRQMEARGVYGRPEPSKEEYLAMCKRQSQREWEGIESAIKVQTQMDFDDEDEEEQLEYARQKAKEQRERLNLPPPLTPPPASKKKVKFIIKRKDSDKPIATYGRPPKI